MATNSRKVRLLAVVAAAAVAASTAAAENWSNQVRQADEYDYAANLDLVVGMGKMDRGDWEPVADHPVVGLDFDYATGPVSVVAALFYAQDSGSKGGEDVSARFTEVQLGARKVWYRMPVLQPYLGGGATAVWLSVEHPDLGPDRYNKIGLGVWAGAGVRFALGDRWHLGVDARWSTVPISIRGNDLDAGGWQTGLVLGRHFRAW